MVGLAAVVASADGDAAARKVIARHEAEVRPLEIELGRRWWDANVLGSEENYRVKREAETRLELRLADRQAFAEIKAAQEQKIRDPRLARQVRLLYLQYLPRQINPDLLRAMVERGNAAEQAFNVFRAKVDGKSLSENDVRRVLRESTDSARRRAVWEASKAVGPVVQRDLLELVKLRNRAAKQLGFADYHRMQLDLNEQDQGQVLALLDQLDELTREPFRQVKAQIDAELARQSGVPVAELAPWHYHDPFFQEAPSGAMARFDKFYQGLDILQLCRDFYAGIGLPIEDVIQRSDLFEKPQKNPHAFCTDIDRQGDVRVLANIVPSRQWLSTMLHELGHAAYSSKNMPADLPYLLRNAAHPLTTEGIAMMFDTLSGQAGWLAAMKLQVPEAAELERLSRTRRHQKLLVFSRWCQVMFRFEKELYGQPDQDLNRLWWDLVERYQLLRRPAGRDAPDYASKIHIVSAPAYYHNYMLGQLFASQVHRAIAREVFGGADPRTVVYAGHKTVGRFLVEKIFALGASVDWNTLTRQATGKELNAAAFAEDL